MVSGEAAQAWRNVSERAILNQTAASWGMGTRAPWLCSCWGETQVQPWCWGHIPGCHRAIWVQEPPQQPFTGILSRCSHRSQLWGQGDSGPGAHAWWKTFPLLHRDAQLAHRILVSERSPRGSDDSSVTWRRPSPVSVVRVGLGPRFPQAGSSPPAARAAQRAGLEAITARGRSRNTLLSCSLNFDLLFNFHSSGKLGDKKDAPMLSAGEEGCER